MIGENSILKNTFLFLSFIENYNGPWKALAVQESDSGIPFRTIISETIIIEMTLITSESNQLVIYQPYIP